MNSSSSISPGCVGVRFSGNRTLTVVGSDLGLLVLVVVCDLDLVGISGLPSKTHPILGIDSDTVLAASLATKLFEPIPRWYRQIMNVPYSVYLVEFSPGD